MVNKRKQDRRLKKSLKKRREECREFRNARAFRNYFVKTGYLPENPEFF